MLNEIIKRRKAVRAYSLSGVRTVRAKHCAAVWTGENNAVRHFLFTVFTIFHKFFSVFVLNNSIGKFLFSILTFCGRFSLKYIILFLYNSCKYYKYML